MELPRPDRLIIGAVEGLFSHGPTALAQTLDHPGDPGLLGPDSVSWRVIGDASALVGGIRALVVQTCHPEVVAGVEQHSRYREDPLGRLTRTSFYVTQTTFGAMPEVEEAVAMARRAHRPVHGTSARGKTYRAGNPTLAAWVHNVLTDSFLTAYRRFGAARLSTADADRFVAEQARIGALLGAKPLPDTAAALSTWVNQHPALAHTDDLESAIQFLRDPPLALGVKIGYRLLFEAAVATLQPRVADLVDLRPKVGALEVGRATVAGLRLALGTSPALTAARARVSAAPAA